MTSQADDLPIRLSAHPYAQGGLSMSSGNPEYAGRHPTSASTHLMASLGLSEVSARHRLPPQLTIGQNRGMDDQQNQKQDRSHSRPLYVQIDSRNSYQDLRPYVRVDSNVAPPEKLWVTMRLIRERVLSRSLGIVPSVGLGWMTVRWRLKTQFMLKRTQWNLSHNRDRTFLKVR